MNAAAPGHSRLSRRDAVAIGAAGLRTRRMRAALSALGIAIGVAAMVAVLGISSSSNADLIAALDRLGTNLLALEPGQSIFGEQTKLPKSAKRMVGRVASVEGAAAVSAIPASVYRTDRIPAEETNSIAVEATETGLLATLAGNLAAGAFLNPATSGYPVVVLGATAARRLGIDSVGVQVWLGRHWFTVAGILKPLELAPELDSAALIGSRIAKRLFGFDGSASTIYVRTRPDDGRRVASLLAATANPEHPEDVQVSRPSDALSARAAAKTAFTSLFLGLGAVALLVGAVGIANVMVISVLERRSEIGLRRALGATERHIGIQFLTESAVLAGIGGVAGEVLGVVATAAYDLVRGWPVVVPAYAFAGAIAAALTMGVVAGLYPASRAARLSPTEALRTT